MSLTAGQIDTIKAEYEPRILATLERWRMGIIAYGWSCSFIDDMSDDCYRWDFAVYPNGETKDPKPGECIDVSFTIAESGPYAGDRDDNGNNDGINVLVDIVDYGGRIVGQMCPYNYSARVWTDDPDEWADRFRAFEAIDGGEIINSIEEFLDRVG